MKKFDLWTVLRIFEVILVLACLIVKRVTDDEAKSIFVYLRKLSREWRLLNNVTWDRVGSSVADATYGGYLIITAALLIGKLVREFPTAKRITERVLLGIGAILFIVIGSLVYASIDSVPHDLIDNAAILGTLSVVTGALFLLDIGAPKAKKVEQPPAQIQQVQKNGREQSQTETETTQPRQGNGGADRPRRIITDQVYDIEQEIERTEISTDIDDRRKDEDRERRKAKKDIRNNGIKNGVRANGATSSRMETALKDAPQFPGRSYIHLDPTSKGYKQMKEEELDIPRRFGIYGRDVTDYGSDTDETASLPPKPPDIELHSPVWSHIRKDKAKKYFVPPAVRPPKTTQDDEPPESPPSGPLDPGYVQYTAQHWGESKREGTKTPRHSPTEV